MLAISRAIFLLVHFEFVMLHTPSGGDVSLNIREISSIRQIDKTEQHVHKDARCLIVMTNGKFVGVVETCIEVIRAIAALERRDGGIGDVK